MSNVKLPIFVVSYWNSTSNHNFAPGDSTAIALYLIEILHQTTTSPRARTRLLQMYLIEILHQTTTGSVAIHPAAELYLIEILHQTTTTTLIGTKTRRCILLKFYIKPQQAFWTLLCPAVLLYLIEILHQTTTALGTRTCLLCCILLKFYIKPQLNIKALFPITVVSYWNSTSNHNFTGAVTSTDKLYLIEILHQTTTYKLQLII